MAHPLGGSPCTIPLVETKIWFMWVFEERGIPEPIFREKISWAKGES